MPPPPSPSHRRQEPMPGTRPIDTIDTLTLSAYINTIRRVLVEEGFFEHTLYSCVPYSVENAPCFRVREKLFLRYGTEPEVWRAGERFSKFFWIGSLYRKEATLTPLHRYEFKLVDVYLRGGSLREIVHLFTELLRHVERNQALQKLSRLEVARVPYVDFQKGRYRKDKRYWLVVTRYPVRESFYDQPLNRGTHKFEVFFVNDGKAVEIASGGIVGPNINRSMYIKSGDAPADRNIFDRKFIGLGVGIERLILLYR